MGNTGSAPKMSAQDYTTMLKRRVVAKSIDNSPQPAHRRYNYVPLLVQGNRADKVVKLVRDPTKACNLPFDPDQTGWSDTSRCCYNPPGYNVNIDYLGAFLSSPEDTEGTTIVCSCPTGECPGVATFPVITQAYNQYNFTFSNGGGYEYAIGVLFVSTEPIEFTTITATINGVSVFVIPNALGNGTFVVLFDEGTLTQSSTIVVNSSIPFIANAACIFNTNFAPP